MKAAASNVGPQADARLSTRPSCASAVIARAIDPAAAPDLLGKRFAAGLAPLPASATPTPLPRRQLVPVDLAKLRGSNPRPLTVKPPSQPAPAALPELACVVQPENTIFPSLLLATANMPRPAANDAGMLGDGHGANLPYVLVTAPVDATPIQVAIRCDAVMEPSTFTGTLARRGERYAILPKIRWKYAELARCRQQVPVDVVFRVQLGNQPAVEHVATCSLRTINDCPLQYQAGGESWKTDLAFAAYVNEDHPWVDVLLREALGAGIVDAFVGYQRREADAVFAQVFAIWHALQARGISYSSITTLAAPQSARLQSQHVRFLDECIQNQQANCIDGTVMLASLLRKIGIGTTIALVPGHAFLIVDLDAQGAQLFGFETTLLGSARPPLGDAFEQASQGSFCQAVERGNQLLAQYRDRFGSSKPEDRQCVAIDVAGARRLGVRPIPFSPASGQLAPRGR